MDFIVQRLIYLNRIFLFCIVLTSCQGIKSDNQEMMLLECILTNFIVAEDNGNQHGSFIIGQYDHWRESTSLIIVSYIPADMVQHIQAEEKSIFGDNDVYFSRIAITDTFTENTVQKITNQLKWEPYNSPNSVNEEQPPFDPITVQLTYNYSSNCIQNIVLGEIHMKKGWESKCIPCANKL
jgi:hypothetical protein